MNNIIFAIAVVILVFAMFLFVRDGLNLEEDVELVDIPGNSPYEEFTEHRRGRRRPRRRRRWRPRRRWRRRIFYPRRYIYYYYPQYIPTTRWIIPRRTIRYCIYRDPLERFVYMYQKLNSDSTRSGLNKFAQKFLDNPGQYYQWLQPQKNFMDRCSYILRYSHLAQDMRRFSQIVGSNEIDLETPSYAGNYRLNASDLKQGVAKKLKEYYAEDYLIRTTWN